MSSHSLTIETIFAVQERRRSVVTWCSSMERKLWANSLTRSKVSLSPATMRDVFTLFANSSWERGALGIITWRLLLLARLESGGACVLWCFSVLRTNGVVEVRLRTEGARCSAPDGEGGSGRLI